MKSIFDGWTKQIFDGSGSVGGPRCAFNYLLDSGALRTAVGSELAHKIGVWIQRNLNPPERYDDNYPWANPLNAIIWANDTSQLDIEGFRTVEKLVTGFVPEAQPSPVEAEGVANG